MEDWDEDTPPSLNSLPDQLHAATLVSSIAGTAGLKDGELRVAATTHAQKPATAGGTAAEKPLKRGFLDSKPSRQAGTRSKPGGTPLIRAKPLEQQQAGRAIPDMFKLEPSEEQRCYGMVKSQLLDALAPTPDTISAVGSDPVLTAGFDDPEVMSAVAEVARDPSAIKKYANNAKVQRFYMAFGKLMDGKLQAAGKQGQQPGSQQQGSSSTSRVSTRELLA
ncbi:hypothetical protein COO60DRAFT_795717 [Scenedesmus sp. NREL 46B-D3]|nr:hypothetical protein COO60DRAFT_795717 [Scenedesmus sp. NREL 46B-D3]